MRAPRHPPSRSHAEHLCAKSQTCARLLRLALWIVCPLAVAHTVAAQETPVVVGDRVRVIVDDRGRGYEPEAESVPHNSTVRGRVLFEETGRPARRVRVMLFDERVAQVTTAGSAMVVTNARGEFEFKGVKAGKYLVAVFAPNTLVPLSFYTPREAAAGGAHDLPELRKYFDEVTADGAGDVEVSVKARKGAAISGRVVYDDGSPAISATVSLFRKKGGQLLRVPTVEQADDRGVYRFTSLPPGDYVVGASELVVHGEAGSGMLKASAVLYGGAGGALFSTYYPAAATLGAATPVRVEAGQEREGVDISIVEREPHTISGTVRARAGNKPVAKARVNIQAADAVPDAIYSAELPDVTTDEHGRWTLKEIPDGDYVITITPVAEMEATEVIAPARAAKPTPATGVSQDEGGDDSEYVAPLQRYTPKRQEVKVAGQDIDNLSIELGNGALILGTVVVEGGKPLPAAFNISAIKVGAGEGEEAISGSYLQGQFAVGGLPAGRYFFSASGGDEEGEEYYVKSMTYNNLDLTREPLRVEDGATLRGVRVVLGMGMATLDGRIVSANDHAPGAYAHVFLVSADAAKWRTPAGQQQQPAGLAGKFTIDAPPGEYLVFALRANGSQPLTEDEIKAQTAHAQRVTLRAGQTANVEITLPGDK